MQIGAYGTAPTSISTDDRFMGWIDELAFYSRVLTDAEIKSNWLKEADITDSSLFIYYNFEEGPGSVTIKNLGVAGPQADLHNGQIFGGPRYFETVSSQLRTVAPCSFVPGAPVAPVQSSPPIVVSLYTSSDILIRITCAISTVTPSSSSITFYNETGQLYQNNNGQHGGLISSFPTVVTSSENDVFYVAQNVSSVERFSYDASCGGVTQSGQVVISIINPATPRSDIMLDLAMDSGAIIFLGADDSKGASLSAEITSLPTLGVLYQLDMKNITGPCYVESTVLALRYFSVNGQIGLDSFTYRIYADTVPSKDASVQINIQAWDDPPTVYMYIYTYVCECMYMYICMYMYFYE
jgi:hypothetical protein